MMVLAEGELVNCFKRVSKSPKDPTIKFVLAEVEMVVQRTMPKLDTVQAHLLMTLLRWVVLLVMEVGPTMSIRFSRLVVEAVELVPRDQAMDRF
jgi:hypothetical protein